MYERILWFSHLFISNLSIAVSTSELENAYTTFKKVTVVNAAGVGDTVDFAQLNEFMSSLGTAWWQRIKQDNQLRIMKVRLSRNSPYCARCLTAFYPHAANQSQRCC
jgi:hypothetical protein